MISERECSVNRRYFHVEMSVAPMIAKTYPSLPLHKEFDGYLFSSAVLEGMVNNYTTSAEDAVNPAAWPILATDAQLLQFPPTLLIGDQCDMLRGDAEALYARLLSLNKTQTLMVVNNAEYHCMSLVGLRNQFSLDAACHHVVNFVRLIDSSKNGKKAH